MTIACNGEDSVNKRPNPARFHSIAENRAVNDLGALWIASFQRVKNFESDLPSVRWRIDCSAIDSGLRNMGGGYRLFLYRTFLSKLIWVHRYQCPCCVYCEAVTRHAGSFTKDRCAALSVLAQWGQQSFNPPSNMVQRLSQGLAITRQKSANRFKKVRHLKQLHICIPSVFGAKDVIKHWQAV